MTPKEKTEYLKKLAEQAKYSFEDPLFNGARDVDFGDEPEQFSPLRQEHREPMIEQLARFASTDPEAQEILRQAGIDDSTQPHDFHTGSRDGGWDGEFWYEPSNTRFVFHVQSRGDDGSKRLFIESRDGDEEVAKVKAAKILSGMPRGAKELSDMERLHIERIAASNPGDAIAVYLNYSYPRVEGEDEMWNVLVSPEHSKRLAEAVSFVHRLSQREIPDSEYPAFQEFTASYLGKRQPTIDLLTSAMTAYVQHRTADHVAESFRSEEPSAPNFDSMTDEEIASLKDSVAREYCRAIRNQRRRG